MMRVLNSVVVVGCVFVGFVTSAGPGLVARAAEPKRWLRREIPPTDDTTEPREDEAQRRINQLEQRLKELEAERSGRASGAPTRGNASSELDAVIARNNELLARNRALAAENQALVQSHLFESPATATACEPPPGDADPKTQLRYWAKRLRDGDSNFSERLTTEQNTAVSVLLRRERVLDPRNPWREL